MTLTVFCLVGFLCGSVPTAYWLARGLKGVDIRTRGSGNVGATNALRVLGKGPGIFVLLIDFAKGWVPVALFTLAARQSPAGPTEASALGVATAAMLGHIFTPWLGFRGGKGVATGAGALLAFSPALWVLSLAVWLGAFYSTRIVSIASLLASGSLIPLSLGFKMQRQTALLFTALFFLIVWTHRQNLKRLVSGDERKL
ncbi:MAG: glycerol-3-phosphate 1-O-acyltransferase PlsY [Candidatus Omnitrophica bacterium]|nr:glycerol-3-phosphate 1-O-acyltransferase PlsY [Candidatus Omnitrophota bacterium]